MKEKLLKLLLAMGVSEANAKLITDFEGDVTKVDESILINEFKAHQLALHENDPAIIKKIDSATAGRERDKFERKMKQEFGLIHEDIKDKSLEEVIKLAKTKANVSTDKTVSDLQQEILDKTNEIKNLKETEIPAIRSEVDNHKKKFNITDKLTKKVSAHKLRNPLEDVMASVGTLESLYDMDLDDKGEIVYYVKGSKLLPKNADGTKFLTADDIIKGKLESGKFLVESNAEEGDGKEKIIVQGAQPDKSKIDVTKLPGYNKAQEHLESMKQKTV